MGNYYKHWWMLIVILAITFSLLGYLGVDIYRKAPPIPDKFMTSSGAPLMTHDSILEGQSAWQSVGGMQLGSIWGHGAYQAPDWTADWLHRELMAWLDIAAIEEFNKAYATLDKRQQNALQFDLKTEYRTNSFDPDSRTAYLSDRRARAIETTADYYHRLFGDAPELKKSRQSFAMKDDTLPDAERRTRLTEFFFWTSWAAATERSPGGSTYTNNWPHEPLIDNRPTSENMVWSIVSIILLIAGIGGLIWGWSFLRKEHVEPEPPPEDPLAKLSMTPSQRALGKYLFLVVALFCFQTFVGGLTAHYTVEGQEFYGIDVSQWFPYSLVRTWHIQSAMFWIASGFLAAGLFLVPVINGGHDPKYQKLGVDLLFWALVVVVVGSFTGNFLAIAHIMPPEWSFWLGHQGYEFVELGRFWQIGKYLGIVFWLVLMLRGMVPALRQPGSDKNLLALLTSSVIAIGLMYGAGFFYGEKTHISIMEYWRWWIVHLWVEGFFEVFATVALAFVFNNMGLVSRVTATSASLVSASLFMLGGVPGTFHHMYFSGTSTPVMAVGATFSALEVVPLVILGYEAFENWRLKDQASWMNRMRWPLAFFVAVAFWNMLGAGVLGFMINPPISLYYIQGLNTTASHAHAALFGVYGFLALGFALFILRYIRPDQLLNDTLMKTAFWCLNGGLVLMIFTSLLPVGLIQFYASVSEGMWYARSEAFMQQDLLQTLRWIRTIGDVVFIIGALAIAWQVVKNLYPRHAVTTVGAT